MIAFLKNLLNVLKIQRGRKGICLVAPHGGGKTTAFQTIVENRKKIGIKQDAIKELKFAGRLKEVIGELLGVEPERLDEQDFKSLVLPNPLVLDVDKLLYILHRFEMDFRKYGTDKINSHVGKALTTPRHCMQYIATEFLRELEPNIHTDILLKEYRKHSDKFIIVTDCNFLNEFGICLKIDLMTVGVVHPEKCLKLDMQTAAGIAHESQKHVLDLLNKCEVKILNDSTLEVYQERIIKSLKGKL